MKHEKKSIAALKLWADPSYRLKKTKAWIFISPDGSIVKFNNLASFCREHGLYASGMFELYHGRRKTHKGWRRYIPE